MYTVNIHTVCMHIATMLCALDICSYIQYTGVHSYSMHAILVCTKLYAWNGCTTHGDTRSIIKCMFSHPCAIMYVVIFYFTNRFSVNLTAFLKKK